ncbi:MAG: hypothetical protein GXY67_11785 [Clostridiales bacterium]|nr:hypothetical protein [Clostridiales bacterium]
MNGYDRDRAIQYISSHMDRAWAKPFAGQLTAVLDAFITLDFQYMHLAGVLDEEGNRGENEYDEDEAFEEILDGYLMNHPCSEERVMELAGLLDQYMEWQRAFLELTGLAE